MDILGLALSFVGAMIIVFFNLPPRVSEDGASHLLLEGTDTGEIKKGKRYRIISRIGLILLAVGFLFQLLDKIV